MSDLSAGLTLTAIGIPVVFGFLGLLVLGIRALGWFLGHPALAVTPDHASDRAPPDVPSTEPLDPAVLVAITAAVRAYRNDSSLRS